jgi:hypothetical protein
MAYSLYLYFCVDVTLIHNGNRIIVSPNAVEQHLNHGDTHVVNFSDQMLVADRSQEFH